MTLVVTDASKYGIVMIGDSALTDAENNVTGGAQKIHYAKQANIGFALWGNFNMPDALLDDWMRRYIRDEIARDEPIEDVCKKLVSAINNELKKFGKSWDELRRGIHVAGYKDGIPVIYHLHTGPELPLKQHELRFHRDYPDIHIGSLHKYIEYLEQGVPIHLRNGYFQHFGILFDSIRRYSTGLGTSIGTPFPGPTLEDRVEFFKMLIRFVADTLKATHSTESVNGYLSAIAFNEKGLVVDDRLQAQLRLTLLEAKFAVCRFDKSDEVPAKLLSSSAEFLSVTRTADELSIVCPEELAPVGAKLQPGWRAFKVEGPLDFSLTGIMASLATPLATAKISLFAVATFDTDYLLVQERDLEAAIAALSTVSLIRR